MHTINPILRTAAIIILATIVSSCAHSQGSAENPAKVDSGGFYEGVIGFYTGSINHLSGVRRGGCPMHPSCSQYSRIAVEKHGFTIGWVMTMDRLLRCGRDELKMAPRVFVDGNWKFYDPVEHNRTDGRKSGALSAQVDRFIEQHERPQPIKIVPPSHSVPYASHPAYRIDPTGQ